MSRPVARPVARPAASDDDDFDDEDDDAPRERRRRGFEHDRRRRPQTDATMPMAVAFGVVTLMVATAWIMMFAASSAESLGLYIATMTIGGLAALFCAAYFVHASTQVDDLHAAAWFGLGIVIQAGYFLAYYGSQWEWFTVRGGTALLVLDAIFFGIAYAAAIVYGALHAKHLAAYGAFLAPFASWAAWSSLLVVMHWNVNSPAAISYGMNAFHWRPGTVPPPPAVVAPPNPPAQLAGAPAVPNPVAPIPVVPNPLPETAPPMPPPATGSLFADAARAARSPPLRDVLDAAARDNLPARAGATLAQLAALVPDAAERDPVLAALAAQFGRPELSTEARKNLVNLALRWAPDDAVRFLRTMAAALPGIMPADDLALLVDAAVRLGGRDAFVLLCELAGRDPTRDNRAAAALQELGPRVEDVLAEQTAAALGERKQQLLRLWGFAVTDKTRAAYDLAKAGTPLPAPNPMPMPDGKAPAPAGSRGPAFAALVASEPKTELKAAFRKIAEASDAELNAAVNELYLLDGPAADDDAFLAMVAALAKPNQALAGDDTGLANYIRLAIRFAPRRYADALGAALAGKGAAAWGTPTALLAALRAVNTPEAIRAIAAGLEQQTDFAAAFENDNLRAPAGLALMEIGLPAEDALVALLDGKNPLARAAAVQALRKVGGAKALAKLLAVAKEFKDKTRTAEDFFGGKLNEKGTQAYLESVAAEIAQRTGSL